MFVLRFDKHQVCPPLQRKFLWGLMAHKHHHNTKNIFFVCHFVYSLKCKCGTKYFRNFEPSDLKRKDPICLLQREREGERGGGVVLCCVLPRQTTKTTIATAHQIFQCQKDPSKGYLLKVIDYSATNYTHYETNQ